VQSSVAVCVFQTVKFKVLSLNAVALLDVGDFRVYLIEWLSLARKVALKHVKKRLTVLEDFHDIRILLPHCLSHWLQQPVIIKVVHSLLVCKRIKALPSIFMDNQELIVRNGALTVFINEVKEFSDFLCTKSEIQFFNHIPEFIEVNAICEIAIEKSEHIPNFLELILQFVPKLLNICLYSSFLFRVLFYRLV